MLLITAKVLTAFCEKHGNQSYRPPLNRDIFFHVNLEEEMTSGFSIIYSCCVFSHGRCFGLPDSEHYFSWQPQMLLWHSESGGKME